jgi:hypothetical protein
MAAGPVKQNILPARIIIGNFYAFLMAAELYTSKQIPNWVLCDTAVASKKCAAIVKS